MDRCTTRSRTLIASIAQMAHGWFAYRLVVATVVAGLASLVVIEAMVTWLMLLHTGELMYGEAILYGHAHRIVSSVPLYQSLDQLPYTVASYTPLFYLLAAGLQAVVGPGLGPGRLLAVLALIAAAVCVGFLATGDGPEHRAGRTGLCAALLFVALGVPGSGPVPWTALYKEDSVALALSLASVLLLSRVEPSSGAATTAGVLAGLATLTKQTYIALALAQLVWLWCFDRGAVPRFAVGALGLVVLIAAALEWQTGAFIDNTVVANVNPSRGDWLASNVQLLLLLQFGPLVATALYLATSRWYGSRFGSLLVFTWIGASLQLLALAKIGGASNHWMPFAALSAVLAARMVYPALANGATSPGVARWAAVCALGGGLLLVAPIAAGTWLHEISALQTGVAADQELSGLVERIRATPSEVFADPLDVLVLADREPPFEPLMLTVLDAAARWDTRLLNEQLCRGSVSLIVLQTPLENASWPDRLRATAMQTMELEGVAADRLVYRPKPATMQTQACLLV